jgi:hypothetical protein
VGEENSQFLVHWSLGWVPMLREESRKAPELFIGGLLRFTQDGGDKLAVWQRQQLTVRACRDTGSWWCSF